VAVATATVAATIALPFLRRFQQVVNTVIQRNNAAKHSAGASAARPSDATGPSGAH